MQRGQVVLAYRVFLGLFEERANRRKLLAQLVFAGLIDVQDRMLFNRSYTTGHKAYRARATVELGNAIGWAQAHSVLYAGVPDIAVGPRWHSTYEMAANVCQALLDGRDHDGDTAARRGLGGRWGASRAARADRRRGAGRRGRRRSPRSARPGLT